MVRATAEATLASVQDQLKRVSDRKMTLVADSSAAAALHKLAAKERATLIVLGSSRRSRIGRVLPRGTGERLLSGAPAAVAIAPGGYAEEPPDSLRTIGCAFDGSSQAQDALDWATSVAARVSAELRILAVHEPVPSARVAAGAGVAIGSINEAPRAQLQEDLRAATSKIPSGLDVSANVLEGEAAEALADASAELDLLVVGSRGYGPVKAALLGSVSSTLVRTASSPLVVVPAGDHDGARPSL